MNHRLLFVSLPLVLVACGAMNSTGGTVELPAQELVDGGDVPDAGASTADAGAALFVYPQWQREDIQPMSPQFGQTYGLDAFRGRTVVVLLLEGFCTFCRGNVVVAERLQGQLRSEGLDVDIVVLSDANASDFVTRTGLRLFRDGSPGRVAWQAMRPGAGKHDTFVFAPNGERVFFWQGSYTGDAARWEVEVGAAARAAAR